MADTVDKTEELYPIAVLIDELKVCYDGRPAIGCTANIPASTMMYCSD